MTKTLEEIVQEYFADTDYQNERRHINEARNTSLPQLQAVIRRFLHKETDIQMFCIELDKVLRSGDNWGALGAGFMMELHKFSKNHNDTSHEAEGVFREILTDLNATNEGKRIELFYSFLLKERERLRREEKSSNTIVSASNSQFIISLFCFWLDPCEETIIYYPSLRKGLYTLIETEILPVLQIPARGKETVEIRSEPDHIACLAIFQYIATQMNNQQGQNIYWPEQFAYWVMQKPTTKSEPGSTVTIDADNTVILAPVAISNPVMKETPPDYSSASPSGVLEGNNPSANSILNDPLGPTPEPLLTNLIHEVQRHILVDEMVIRRVYHALLAGHVILTGPPGTGKTELARIIPEVLWQSPASSIKNESPTIEDEEIVEELSTRTAYTTRLVTATDDWSPRTLISGIAPQSQNGTVTYKVQFCHLTTTILKNWSFQGERPEEWSTLNLQRTRITTSSSIERGKPKTFRGQWLVIDEFNRAPIDLALGDALTALGGNDVLRVGIENGVSAELPIPQDFRIIGTLNSFDRNYLNQISEALKRRFSFVEILPPARYQREAEQGIVLYKALQKIKHLSTTISIEEDSLNWNGNVMIGVEPSGQYSIFWDDTHHPFYLVFEAAWRLFEVIRIYRQLGTAQAISLIRHLLITGIMRNCSTLEDWVSQALDSAFCDTIADQLQVLLPDEIEVLYLYLTTSNEQFSLAYNRLLTELLDRKQRLYGQLIAINSVDDENTLPYLTDEEVEQLAQQENPAIKDDTLRRLFHLDHERYKLPQFTKRLRTFKAERGL